MKESMQIYLEDILLSFLSAYIVPEAGEVVGYEENSNYYETQLYKGYVGLILEKIQLDAFDQIHDFEDLEEKEKFEDEILLEGNDAECLKNEVSCEVMAQNGCPFLDHLALDVDFGVHLDQTIKNKDEYGDSLEEGVFQFTEDEIVGDGYNVVKIEDTNEKIPENEPLGVGFKEANFAQAFIEAPLQGGGNIFASLTNFESYFDEIFAPFSPEKLVEPVPGIFEFVDGFYKSVLFKLD